MKTAGKVVFALTGCWFATAVLAQQHDAPEISPTANYRVPASLLGPYPLSRDASGASWQPDASQAENGLGNAAVWITTGGYTDTLLPIPGNAQSLEANLLAFQARHVLGRGALGLRGEVMLPAKLRTGNFELPADRQTANPSLLAFAASYSWLLTQNSAIFGYIGFPGEPALGASLYAHPLAFDSDRTGRADRHWLDSKGLNSNVLTVGYVWRNLKLEGSAFNERERDDKPMALGSPRPFGLKSGRISFNPTPNWALQISRGQRNRPDQVDPNDEIRRTTVSAIHDRVFGRNNWQTTLAFGRSAKQASGSTNAFLLESVLKMHDNHTFFGRFEQASGDELFAEDETLHGQSFDARKFTLGYVHDVAATGPIRIGIGALASKRFIPSEQVVPARAEAASCKVFVRLSLQFP